MTAEQTPFWPGRDSPCWAAGRTGYRVPRNAPTLRLHAAKITPNPDCRLDQLTKANRRKPSLKFKSQRLKLVDTFRKRL